MKPTPLELLEMKSGHPMRVCSSGFCDSGAIVYRSRQAVYDDLESVGFSYEPDAGDGWEWDYFSADELEYVEDHSLATGIARPVLEERKLGKISIELFDEGFPNAVLAICEVMTWAAEHKGYKPHDWKNLPGARTAFLAAASRHRVKRHIQHVSGVAVEAQVDEESKLLHLAHEAFNVMAQLELAITNRLN